MGQLRLVSKDPYGRRIDLLLRLGDNTLGRLPDCDIVINESECSRVHARITVSVDSATVSDLGSQNATFLNNQPVGQKEVAIEHGDELIIGVSSFTVEVFAENDGDWNTVVNIMQARRAASPAEAEPKTSQAHTEKARTLETTVPVAQTDLQTAIRRRMTKFARYPFIEVMGRGTGARRYLIKHESLTIGRRPDNHVVLNDAGVSGYHARLQKTDNGIVIEDLASRNGTFVNRQPIKRQILDTQGAHITIGDTVLRFVPP